MPRMAARVLIIPPEEFVAHAGIVAPHLSSAGASFDLDKAWTIFHRLFQKMPRPIPGAIRGDLGPLGGLDEDPADPPWLGFVTPKLMLQDDPSWLSFVTPKTVAEIAPALDRVEASEVVKMLEEEEPLLIKSDDDRRYFARHFECLKEAYRTASREEAGLAVHIC
jgi:hypothetical protein